MNKMDPQKTISTNDSSSAMESQRVISPDSNRSAEPPGPRHRRRLVSLVAVPIIGLIALGYFSSLSMDGFNPSEILENRAHAAGEVANKLQVIGVANPVSTLNIDEKCDIRSMDHFGQVKREFACRYSTYVYIRGSGKKAVDISNLRQKILRAGFRTDGHDSSDEELALMDTNLTPLSFEAENYKYLVELATFDNLGQLKTYNALRKYPKQLFTQKTFADGYVVGFRITDSYAKGQCVLCLNSVLK